jgi:hypothetical protein
MQEQIFFNAEGVAVTNTRFVVPGETYALSGISSVRLEREEPFGCGPWLDGSRTPSDVWGILDRVHDRRDVR